MREALETARGTCIAQLQENKQSLLKQTADAQESLAVVQTCIVEKTPAAAAASEAAAANAVVANVNGKKARVEPRRSCSHWRTTCSPMSKPQITQLKGELDRHQGKRHAF